MRWVLLLFFAVLPVASRAADLPPDWAYKPVGKTAVPSSTSQNPIDSFILANANYVAAQSGNPARELVLIRGSVPPQQTGSGSDSSRRQSARSQSD